MIYRPGCKRRSKRFEYLCASIKPEARSIYRTIDRDLINHGLEKRIIRPSANELYLDVFFPCYETAGFVSRGFQRVSCSCFSPGFSSPRKGKKPGGGNWSWGIVRWGVGRSLWTRWTCTTLSCYVFSFLVYFVEYLNGFYLFR